MPRTYSWAEADFEDILCTNSFMTASLKEDAKAPRVEDGPGFYGILPDIVAIDKRSGQGWCFEVKDDYGEITLQTERSHHVDSSWEECSPKDSGIAVLREVFRNPDTPKWHQPENCLAPSW